MIPRRQMHFAQAVLGLALGYTLSRMGFADFAEIQKMFTLTDLRLFFSFCGSVAFAAAGFAVLRLRRPPGTSIHPSVPAGGVLFGAGWAVTGTCPGSVIVQVGEGQLWGLASMAGIVAGTWLYGRVHARYFRWSPGTCAV